MRCWVGATARPSICAIKGGEVQDNQHERFWKRMRQFDEPVIVLIPRDPRTGMEADLDGQIIVPLARLMKALEAVD
jgi:hypothetical protein